MQSAFGKEIHADLFAKAAAFLDSIANNHGFRDGNKRTAMAATALYLHDNGVELRFTNEEYEKFMIHVVNNKPGTDEIRDWLLCHTSEKQS
jgi:death on curing protein